MSDYGSGYTFDSSGNPIASGGMGLPDPSTIYNNNDGSTPAPDPAGDIVSGSFGNNGGSVGDNGPGGTTAGDAGTGGGAPTQADYQNLVKQYGQSTADTIMGQVVKDNPTWASQIGQFVPAIAKGITNGVYTPPTSTTPTGTTPGGTSGPGTTDLAGLAAAAGLAYQQFNNANQYTTQSQADAAQLNPYGAYRDAAAQQLAALQANPSSVANTPGYQFALSQMMGAAANRDNRSYGVGAGSTTNDMMTQAQGLASQTYNNTVNQLSAQAGVNITPAAAASILQTGMQGSIASQNNAVNALMSPFGPGNNTGGSTNGTGINWNNTFGGNAVPVINATTNPPDPTYNVNNQTTPSVPVDPNNPDPNLQTVPNNNTGVIPGGT